MGYRRSIRTSPTLDDSATGIKPSRGREKLRRGNTFARGTRVLKGDKSLGVFRAEYDICDLSRQDIKEDKELSLREARIDTILDVPDGWELNATHAGELWILLTIVSSSDD